VPTRLVDAPDAWYYVFLKGNTGAAMTTTITAKGQVTLPKNVRKAVGLKPGDRVDVHATASGGVYIEKPGTASRYRKRLETLAKRRLVRGITTDEYMKTMRGDPDDDGDNIG
jgi:antitoxin PrlF